jgi:hypothetical protein
MRTARKVGFAVLLLLLLVGAVTLLMAHSKEPDLMRIAQHLPYGPGDPGGPNAYYWLTDSELLYLSPMQKAGANEVYRLNVHTGPVKTQGAIQSGSLHLSPNGKWALTIMQARGGDIYFIERTDGKRQLRYRRSTSQDPFDVVWTTDDKKMVVSVSTMDGARLLTYPLDKLASIAPIDAADLYNTLRLGVLPDNRVLAVSLASCDPIIPHHKTIDLIECALNNGVLVHKHVIPYPNNPNTFTLDAALAPNGERIAWLFSSRSDPPFYDFLYSVYNALGRKPADTVSLYISKSDGGDMRALGNVSLKAGDAAPNNLRWTPSGDNLSFLYHARLYLVPVH